MQKSRLSRAVALQLLFCGATVAALSPLLSQRAEAAPAANFSPKKEGYAVYLPGKPMLSSRPMALPNGGSITVNFVTVKAPPLSFVVIPMTLPAAPKGKVIDQFLGGVQSGFTMSTSAKLLSSKKISLGGAPGREVLIQVGQNLMRGRFFVKGNRSYQVIAISPRADAAKYAPQITQVLDSFRITN